MILRTSLQDKLLGYHLALLNSNRRDDDGSGLLAGLGLAGCHVSPLPPQPMLAGLA